MKILNKKFMNKKREILHDNSKFRINKRKLTQSIFL